MKTLIIAGGKFENKFAVSFLQNNKYDYVIAVDKGLEYAKTLGITPNLWVGDFDSVTDMGTDETAHLEMKVEQFCPEKDDTDTEIAVKKAVAMNSDFDIICGTGGRLDHFLSTIHNLKLALDGKVEGRIIDASNIIYLKDKSFSVSREECLGKYISFVPFSGEVKNIILKGFKYPLNGYDLKPGVSRCISNELAEDTATVSFDSGCLIVINSLDVEAE